MSSILKKQGNSTVSTVFIYIFLVAILVLMIIIYILLKKLTKGEIMESEEEYTENGCVPASDDPCKGYGQLTNTAPPSLNCAWISDCSAPCIKKWGFCTSSIDTNNKTYSNGRSRSRNSCDKCSGNCC
jgi:hypothetical protein